jgi:ankyrin repeat protein
MKNLRTDQDALHSSVISLATAKYFEAKGFDFRRGNFLNAAVCNTVEKKELMDFFIQAGCNVNYTQPDQFQNTPLHILIVNENKEDSIYFIESCKKNKVKLEYNTRDFEGKTTLILAAKCVAEDVAIKIAEEIQNSNQLKETIDLQDKYGNSALHYACALGQTKLAKKLIELGADIDSLNNDGKKPVDLCITNKDGIATILNSVCIDPSRDETSLQNTVIDYYRQPLFNSSNYSFCKELPCKKNKNSIQQKFDKGIFDTSSIDPLLMQQNQKLGRKKIVKETNKEHLKFVQDQIDAITGTSLKDRIAKNQMATIKELIQNEKIDYGYLIRIAANSNYFDLLEILSTGHNFKDMLNSQGKPSLNTALHYAANCGHDKICKKLLELGSDITLKNKDGKTALDIAKEKNKFGVCEILKSYEQQNQDIAL